MKRLLRQEQPSPIHVWERAMPAKNHGHGPFPQYKETAAFTFFQANR